MVRCNGHATANNPRGTTGCFATDPPVVFLLSSNVCSLLVIFHEACLPERKGTRNASSLASEEETSRTSERTPSLTYWSRRVEIWQGGSRIYCHKTPHPLQRCAFNKKLEILLFPFFLLLFIYRWELETLKRVSNPHPLVCHPRLSQTLLYDSRVSFQPGREIVRSLSPMTFSPISKFLSPAFGIAISFRIESNHSKIEYFLFFHFARSKICFRLNESFDTSSPRKMYFSRFWLLGITRRR